MNDGRGTSHVVTLDAPRALPGGLSTEEFAALRAIKKRKRLEASAIYRARAHAIRDLTGALGYHRPARPAPRPAGEFLRVVCWNIERGKRLDGIRAYRSFNAMGVGTTRYEVDTFEGASMVRDYLPQIAVDFLRWNLRPWNGVAPLKLDWFAGRGVWALASGERREASGRESLSPTPFEKPSWNGRRLSDHDPILVDVVW